MNTHELINLYQNGVSLAELGRTTEYSPFIIKQILIKNGIVIRSRNEQNKFSPQNQRKYSVNDNYFKTLSNNMSYLLGFIAADGCVLEKSNILQIALAEVDKSFIELIAKELETNYPISTYTSKKGYTSCKIAIRSSEIFNDLKNYNIIPRKTYHFQFPKETLPKEYWLDFIRGYFDGDGTVCTAGRGAIRWSLCSYSKNFLEEIVNILFDFGIPKVNIYLKKDTNTYYIQYSTNSTKKLYTLLYTENCLCLPRKLIKYQSLL